VGSSLDRLLKNSLYMDFKPVVVIPVETGIQSFQYVPGYALEFIPILFGAGMTGLHYYSFVMQ